MKMRATSTDLPLFRIGDQVRFRPGNTDWRKKDTKLVGEIIASIGSGLVVKPSEVVVDLGKGNRMAADPNELEKVD
jgi:hypothetical protein